MRPGSQEEITLELEKVPCSTMLAKATRDVATQPPAKEHPEEAIWHRIVLVATTDPVTGNGAILINETDISRLKLAMTQIAEERENREQFFLAISHDLRTPLNGIIGLSTVLLEDTTISEASRRSLVAIRSSGQRLCTLVSDIVDSGSVR